MFTAAAGAVGHACELSEEKVKTRQSSLLRLTTLVLISLSSRTGLAQLAPTGSHYAGRASDTGHEGPTSHGGYAASIPLDLPPSRGGLPIPVQIVSGTKGFGAGGVGWDVPLSFVRVDSSYAHRRPSMNPDNAPVPRQRITVALPGRQVEMLPLTSPSTKWIGRYAPDVTMIEESGTWKVFDGNGRTYTFVQDIKLIGTGIWLLDTIGGPGGASVELSYTISNVTVYDYPQPAVAVDLDRVSYNPHPSAGCFKNEVTLAYGIPFNPQPKSLSVLGDRLVVRDHRLTAVSVRSRATCASALELLRRYSLTYEIDPDTQQERLVSATLSGRSGTPEAAISLPVAAYQYGTASSISASGNRALRYETADINIALPLNIDAIASTVKSDIFQSPIPGFDSSYISQHALMDMTGDGRPDLIFEQDDQLWIARNLPGASGNTIFGLPQSLDDGTFTSPYLDARSMQVDRFTAPAPRHSNSENVWRQALDVNGDGRIDIIDAAEEPLRWTIYLNTPTSNGSGIAWMKRAYDVEPLYHRFEQLGLQVADGYLPLSHRFTGRGYNAWYCWEWDVDLQEWVHDPDGVDHEEGCYTNGQPPSDPGYNLEKTYVEWEVKDTNGDGYPDVVFDSSPVEYKELAYAPPPPTDRNSIAHEIDVAIVTPRPIAYSPSVELVMNVGGAYISKSTSPEPVYPFSAPLNLDYPKPCSDQWGTLGAVVGLWETNDDNGNSDGVQVSNCTLAEVNGDGIADIISGRTANLGDGAGFLAATISLPYELVQANSHASDCQDGEPNTFSVTLQRTALRDVTGDGVPDFIILHDPGHPWRERVYPGTAAGFVGAILQDGTSYGGTPLEMDGPFEISSAEEECDGSSSRTLGGLYDIDGDGKPEPVFLANGGTQLTVHPLIGGSRLGVPEAGRVVQIDNGYGAVTQIMYRSAKEDWRTRHQVPFPEIVVDQVKTTGNMGFGGSLAVTQYAYGNSELFYDSMLDAFRPTGYLRSIELTRWDAAPPLTNASATIVDRYPLDTSMPQFLTAAQRFGRYLRAGRVRDVTTLALSIDGDAWTLLGTDIATDPNAVGGVHHDIDMAKTRLFADTLAPANSQDCVDMVFPYDFESSVSVTDPGYNPCAARGFLYTLFTSSWRGGAAPPSASNVQSGVQVQSVDDFGHATSVLQLNDLAKTDDDICVDIRYAAPTGSNERVLAAIADRKIRKGVSCSGEGGGADAVLAEESFEYDKLPVGLVTAQGALTAHTVYRHESDTGNWISTIREFDVDYDALGNPYQVTRGREDGAQQTTLFQYDPFGLVPVQSSTQGSCDSSGCPATLTTSSVVDEVSTELRELHDPNGTVRAASFDGFGRLVSQSVTTPDGTSAVLETRSYLGFEGGDIAGRRVVIDELTDEVGGNTRTTTKYFDELGRLRYGEVELGEDYDDTLIVGKREYDALGRVAFEADPYPGSEESATAYGTTWYYEKYGSPIVAIRGAGPQPYSLSPDATAERFPTVWFHTFSGHTEFRSVMGSDALTPGSPQYQVGHEVVSTAVGRVLTRSTWQSGTRLEHARFEYDRLGHQTKIVRYQDPMAPGNPVEWGMQYDSIGQLLQLTEPSSSSQHREFSDFGELKQVTWSAQVPYSELSVAHTYDAFGRLTASEERQDGNVDLTTVRHYTYDDPAASPTLQPTYVLGRLSSATSQSGEVQFSYDAYGNVNAHTFIDTDNNVYVDQQGFYPNGGPAWIELNLPDNNYASERVEYGYDTAGRARWMFFNDPTHDELLFAAKEVDTRGRLRLGAFGRNEIPSYRAEYSAGGRGLLQMSAVDGNSYSLASYFEEYDPVGRELLVHEEQSGGIDGERIHTYDALGRLSSSRGPHIPSGSAFRWTYDYDPLGNVLSLTDELGQADASLSYLTTDRDRICRVGYGDGGLGGADCNVTYDSRGNVVEMPTRTGIQAFAYFNSGDVRHIENSSGASANFNYGPFGDLQEIEILDQGEARRARYHGSFVTEHSNGDDDPILSREFPGPGLVFRRIGPEGRLVLQFKDGRGTSFTADDDGEFMQFVDYSPYGEATSFGLDDPRDPEYTHEQWNAGEALEEFGLVHLGARIYNPVIGRFLSRDPVLIPRTSAMTNPYAFAFNDPTNYSDSTGLCPECDSWGGEDLSFDWIPDDVVGHEIIHVGGSDESNAAFDAALGHGFVYVPTPEEFARQITWNAGQDRTDYTWRTGPPDEWLRNTDPDAFYASYARRRLNAIRAVYAGLRASKAEEWDSATKVMNGAGNAGNIIGGVTVGAAAVIGGGTLLAGGRTLAADFVSEVGPASRIVYASEVSELGAVEGTVVLGHYSIPISVGGRVVGVQETIKILSSYAPRLGGRLLDSLPGSITAIGPALDRASRIVFFVSPEMVNVTAQEMEYIQTNGLIDKTLFVLGAF